MYVTAVRFFVNVIDEVVGPKLLAERPRNNSTGLETLLVIINDDIVASPEKGKHQVVIHLIHKRLSS